MRSVCVLSFFILSAFILSVLVGGLAYSEDADSLRLQGDEAYKAKDYDKAIELYKASLKINGKNWQVHESLGNAYFKAQRYAEAAASYAEALGYNPQLLSAYYNIGFSYLKAGLYNDAIKNLLKYISLKSDDPDGYYRLAQCFHAVGEKDKAIKNYEKFLSIANKDVSQKKIDDAKARIAELKDSGSAPASAPLSPIANLPSQQPVLSSTAPSTAIPPSTPIGLPPSPTISAGLSNNTSSAGPSTSPPPSMSPRSQSSTTTAKKVNLDNDPAIEIIKEADGHLANGNYRLAISTYRDALIKNPNSIQARYNLGIALAKIERYEQAIAEWEKVLQLDPENLGAKENIKRVKERTASGEGVQTSTGSAKPLIGTTQSVSTAQQTKTSQIEDLLSKANKANSVGDYATAVKHIDELMVIRKDIAESYVIKGDALLGMARYLDAINEFKKALAINPQIADALFGMAEAYRLLAKTDMAIQYYKLFLNSSAPNKAKWRMDRASKMLNALESIR